MLQLLVPIRQHSCTDGTGSETGGTLTEEGAGLKPPPTVFLSYLDCLDEINKIRMCDGFNAVCLRACQQTPDMRTFQSFRTMRADHI